MQRRGVVGYRMACMFADEVENKRWHLVASEV
jgi:hypothetical protein